jgi:putative ABC transport system permease protein
MILRLVWENICFRPMRTLLSVLLIGVPVMLILTLVGVTQGFMDDSHRRTRGVGADIFVRPPGSSIASFSGAPMSEKLAAVLAKQPHVVQAEGVVQTLAGKMAWDSITGIDYATFKRMSGGFIFTKNGGDEEHIFRQPGDVVVDTTFADEQHVHRGDKVKLLNRYWNVAAVVEPGKQSHAFVDIRELQELNDARGHISQIYLKLDDPANTEAVIKALNTLPGLEGYVILSVRHIIELASVDNIPSIKIFVNVIIGIGVFTGLIVVSLSMYMAVLQRTREIGILKSLGATKAFVMNLILWEAAAMGLGGTVAGIALSFASRAALKQFVPASLPQAIVPIWWPIVFGIALGSALLGAIYPGMIAVRQDPIEALSYE